MDKEELVQEIATIISCHHTFPYEVIARKIVSRLYKHIDAVVEELKSGFCPECDYGGYTVREIIDKCLKGETINEG